MTIVLYDEGLAEELEIVEVARYLQQKLGRVKIEVKGSLFGDGLSRDSFSNYAGEIASAKIQDIQKKITAGHEPLYAEVEYEKRRILGKTKSFGILYDGFHLLRVIGKAIMKGGINPDFIHIIITNRLLATWDESNQRYHLRTSLYAIPSIISTTGLVEAPAKPREYYLLKQRYERLGKGLGELKDSFKGSFLDYGDKRLTEVVKGYAMQAVFYSMTGDPFCEDRGCRLYNAHWQEELIFAQLAGAYEFCPTHEAFLRKVQTLHNLGRRSGKH